MWLAKATALLCLLILTGCRGVNFKRTKGTSREKGISVFQKEARQNKEFLEDFKRYDDRLDSSKKRPKELTIYHDGW
jgi:hypothetical protein